MSDPARREIGFRRSALHLGALWALAFAQPLLDLLGRNAEFFVARGSTRGDILAAGLRLHARAAARRRRARVGARAGSGPPLGWAAQLVLVGLLVDRARCCRPPATLLGGSALALAVAPVLGALAAALYARVAPVRTFATVLSPAPLVVLLLFLVVSPVRDLLHAGDATAAVAGPGALGGADRPGRARRAAR